MKERVCCEGVCVLSFPFRGLFSGIIMWGSGSLQDRGFKMTSRPGDRRYVLSKRVTVVGVILRGSSSHDLLVGDIVSRLIW